ncbi:MAG TPA: AsmA family protein, partial [Chromatiales bacterium]|nr:AsmA family protein [Chromatiales bacterium]
ARLIREGKAKLKGKTLPPSNEANQTDFSELKASAAIRNGVLNNQDFLAKSPFLRVTGKGTVNLVGETLDYTATPVIVATSKGQGGAELEELKGVPVPIHLTGSWLKPDWSIDWKSVLTASQKAKLEEKKKELKAKVDKKVEEKKEKIQEKLQDKLKGGLKGLFN